MPVEMKRAYEKPKASDGIRILVDRLWPRGVKKSDAKIDEWMKELAPSDALRKWYGHRPDRWKEFSLRYRKELHDPAYQASLHRIRSLAQKKHITLIFAAKDRDHCNALVLMEVLRSRR